MKGQKLPDDDKPFMRLAVAQIIVKSLKKLNLRYPAVAQEEKARFSEMRTMLEKEKR